MKVLPVKNKQTECINKSPSFQKGLTSAFAKKTRSMSEAEMYKRVIKNGIASIDYKNIKSVLACCLATTEIIKSFGLMLPKAFSFNSLKEGCIGMHTYPDNIVEINSKYKEFEGLASLDDFATYRKGSPVTKHFLQSYIHEFIHAAHFKHMATLHSPEKIVSIANAFKQYEPTEKLLTPIVFRRTWEKWEEKWNNSILGDNAKRNLFEFLAENETFEISRILEKNPLGKNDGENLFFNPKKKEKLSLSFLKEDNFRFFDRIFNKRNIERKILLKAIWNGDLDTILDKKYSKYIRKKAL